jgi:hypothetical protein
MSNEELVRRQHRVEAFLKDEIITQALLDLKEDNYIYFTNAATSDQRVTAWAKAQALADFSKELLRLVDAGKRASSEIEKAEKKTPARIP